MTTEEIERLLQRQIIELRDRLADHATFSAQIAHLADDVDTIKRDVKSLLLWRAYTLGASAAIAAAVTVLLKHL
jgi:hypothetical protein